MEERNADDFLNSFLSANRKGLGDAVGPPEIIPVALPWLEEFAVCATAARDILVVFASRRV